MFVQKLFLENFRLFSQLLLEFNHQVTVIVAPNARGKSTVAEAVRLLSAGESFRAGKIEEMIQLDQELGRAKAKILSQAPLFQKSDVIDLEGLDELELSVLLTRGSVNNKKTHKLLFSINNNRRLKKKFVGQLLTVVFRPEDMRLIEGSPLRRRDFLDSPLALTDYEYAQSLNQYNQALRRRNRLLSLIKENQQSREVLTYWNLALVKHGEQLQKKRRDLIEYINSTVEKPLNLNIKYLPSLISQKRIQDHITAEIAAGFTLIGPHKDDFEVALNLETQKKDTTTYQSLNAYGSRGQKRMGVIWLKKAELMYLKAVTERLPVLILDDILSELDQSHRKRVLELIDGEQIMITTVDPKLVAEIEAKFGKVGIIKLNGL